MSGQDPDLAEFLKVVAQLTGQHLAPGQSLAGPQQTQAAFAALSEADVIDLALETAGMDNALRWLAETVVTVAHSSPSIAFVLAGRYAAHRALKPTVVDNAGRAATLALVPGMDPADPGSFDGLRVTVPLQFDPDRIVLVEQRGTAGAVVTGGALHEEAIRRTGLVDARLRTVRVTGPAVQVLEPSAAAGAAIDLTVLVAAAALGTAEAALQASESYAVDRRQFGGNLLSFTGIRAMLVEMRLRAAAVRGLLELALAQDRQDWAHLELAAVAGRGAVDTGIDAIQIHGGYGYVDEYPVAGLLRDALSLRARLLPRRSSLAGLADARFGPVA